MGLFIYCGDFLDVICRGGRHSGGQSEVFVGWCSRSRGRLMSTSDANLSANTKEERCDCDCRLWVIPMCECVVRRWAVQKFLTLVADLGLKGRMRYHSSDLGYYHRCIQWTTGKRSQETWGHKHLFWLGCNCKGFNIYCICNCIGDHDADRVVRFSSMVLNNTCIVQCVIIIKENKVQTIIKMTEMKEKFDLNLPIVAIHKEQMPARFDSQGSHGSRVSALQFVNWDFNLAKASAYAWSSAKLWSEKGSSWIWYNSNSGRCL